MTRQYRLYCEYTHCCGKQVVEFGMTDTEEKARQWKTLETQKGKRPRLEDKDLVLTCPVKHCPAKIQVPRYDYSPC